MIDELTDGDGSNRTEFVPTLAFYLRRTVDSVPCTHMISCFCCSLRYWKQILMKVCLAFMLFVLPLY